MICPPLSVFCLFWVFFVCVCVPIDSYRYVPIYRWSAPKSTAVKRKWFKFCLYFPTKSCSWGRLPYKKLKAMQWGYTFPSFVGVLKDYLYKYIRRTRVYLLSVCLIMLITWKIHRKNTNRGLWIERILRFCSMFQLSRTNLSVLYNKLYNLLRYVSDSL